MNFSKMLWNNITVVFTELNVSLSNTEWLPSKHELLIEFDLLSHPFAIHINCLSHVCFPCVWLWLSTLVILRNWKPVLLCCAVPLTIVPEKAHGWLLVILYQLKTKSYFKKNLLWFYGNYAFLVSEIYQFKSSL